MQETECRLPDQSYHIQRLQYKNLDFTFNWNLEGTEQG